ncbi:hypothetical protein P3X46_027946 [Hevea brasiliensis]|uniref:Transmembrane protein n=1 Tax=Hevea brasiliensis TaxID=3981 RepID=A0ABQ9L4K6_HEVBR|nr:uncharacterized protein LOC110669398 [Hevea brasiliensis]KAJ9154627.1 hypothetical protein P3X46_027946 [Hevea brasiliensis]
MDRVILKERDFEVDLENGVQASDEDQSKDSISGVKKQSKELLAKICAIFADGAMKSEDELNLCPHAPNSNGVSVEQVNLDGEKTVDHVEKKVVKEKRKKMRIKKASKPPRPPRGPSLDAADQMLIKEITELAMLKRARAERMKALKKMKAAKASSSNSNVFAMVFTIIFCLVIIFQAMSSRVTPVNVQGSPLSTETAESGLITVRYFGNPSASNPSEHSSESPHSIKPIAGFDPPENLRRAVG